MAVVWHDVKGRNLAGTMTAELTPARKSFRTRAYLPKWWVRPLSFVHRRSSRRDPEGNATRGVLESSLTHRVADLRRRKLR